MKTKFYTVFILFLLLSSDIFSQLNIPAHFAYVKGGEYREFSRDSSQVYTQKIEPFYMYRFEVSVHNFETFCKETNRSIPNQPQGSNGLVPVVNITYTDAIDYCTWLTKKYKMNFRLPTKEEWEFSARGGNFETDKFIYNKELPNEYVQYTGNSKEKPNCISCMQPNEFGLYAMVGNVWEWTEQRLKGFETFIVGGSFFEDADHVKVTTKKEMNMNHRQQDLGFRMLVEAKEFESYLKSRDKK